MTTFPRSPKLLKGAIVALPLPSPIPNVIIFQYNPREVRRSLRPRVGGRSAEEQGEADRSEALRLQGPPIETLALTVEIDATDQLERADPAAVTLGIYPQLSALELLLYPASDQVLASAALSVLGTLEIEPPEAPLTLLVWGEKRVVPVRLGAMTITEQAYDTTLNPIRAEVTLSLRVLTYDDFEESNPGQSIFLVHQVIKEALSAFDTVRGVGAAVSGQVRLL